MYPNLVSLCLAERFPHGSMAMIRIEYADKSQLQFWNGLLNESPLMSAKRFFAGDESQYHSSD